MGCPQSTGRKLYNEDVDIKHKFMAGFHISKGGDGMEANIQIGLGTARKKRYEEVSTVEEENVQGEPGSIEGNVQDESVQGV